MPRNLDDAAHDILNPILNIEHCLREMEKAIGMFRVNLQDTEREFKRIKGKIETLKNGTQDLIDKNLRESQGGGTSWEKS